MHRTNGVSEICACRNRTLCSAKTCWLLSRGTVDRNRTYSTNTTLVFNVSLPHFAFTPASVPDDVLPVGKSRISIVNPCRLAYPSQAGTVQLGVVFLCSF